jgi:hypothetical protein
VAFIRLGRYTQALNLMNDTHVYERAYCLYRMNKTQDALEWIDSVLSQETTKKLQFETLKLQVVNSSIDSMASYIEKKN